MGAGSLGSAFADRRTLGATAAGGWVSEWVSEWRKRGEGTWADGGVGEWELGCDGLDGGGGGRDGLGGCGGGGEELLLDVEGDGGVGLVVEGAGGRGGGGGGAGRPHLRRPRHCRHCGLQGGKWEARGRIATLPFEILERSLGGSGRWHSFSLPRLAQFQMRHAAKRYSSFSEQLGETAKEGIFGETLLSSIK